MLEYGKMLIFKLQGVLVSLWGCPKSGIRFCGGVLPCNTSIVTKLPLYLYILLSLCYQGNFDLQITSACASSSMTMNSLCDGVRYAIVHFCPEL